MADQGNIAWHLVDRPTGEVSDDLFEVRETAVPVPGPGEVLVRNVYLFVPASMRLWMNERATYWPPQPLGEVMRGITLGVVEQSDDPALPVGTYVNGIGGWQHYAVAPVATLMPLAPHPAIPLGVYRTVLDVQGLTAWAGVTDVCKAQPGETMVVTAAAGSVGSLAAQIAKKLGLRVVGVAGGPDKCRWLADECGLDGAIDYKNDDVAARLDDLCPDGIDCVFENVGGPVMDLIHDRLNTYARIALCGVVASYNGQPQTGGRSLMELVYKCATLRGFLVLDYLDSYAEAMSTLTPWVLDGSLKYRLEILEGGLSRAPEAMNRLARGQNLGVQLVEITPP